MVVGSAPIHMLARYGIIDMMHRLLVAVLGLAGMVATPVLAAELAIEVRGIRSGDGRLFVAVHGPENSAKFPSADGVVAGLHQRARAGTLRFVLRDLPPGRYAVNAFHDENDNGELDTNLVGIPTEGYGFANDPSVVFGLRTSRRPPSRSATLLKPSS